MNPGLIAAAPQNIVTATTRPLRFSWLLASLLLCLLASFFLQGCSTTRSNSSTLTFLLESNPANLDPRFATDAASQHLDGLLFSSLLVRDDQMNLHGDLAESWQTPNPLTYIFHLRPGVRFHDGRPLTSADVKSTFDYILDPANHSPKRGAFRMVTGIEAPDATTVIFHLKEPYASFTTNLVRPAVGIVPRDARADFARHPSGSGPFRFVSQSQDDEVILERNPDYYALRRTNSEAVLRPASAAENKLPVASFSRVRFRVVPDAIVRALELRKGSADLEVSSLTPDIIPVLAKQRTLAVTQRPGTNFTYLGINLEDPILKRREVRQALAFATDRESLIRYLLHGQAQVANGILPPSHWAYEPSVTRYALDTSKAK